MRFAAPGKLFVSGEYAVLWGGVARVLAVGPEGWVDVIPGEDGAVRLERPGHFLEGLATPQGVHWRGAVGEHLRVAAHTVDWALRRFEGGASLGFTLRFSGNTESQAQKRGLGTSARTAALSARAVLSQTPWVQDAAKVALLGHRDAQGGRGSGSDVLACSLGGFVASRRYDVDALARAARETGPAWAFGAGAPVEAWRCSLPRYPMAYVYSGTSASTVERLARLGDPPAPDVRDFVRGSDDAGTALEQALERQDFVLLCEAVQSLQERLERFARVHTDATRQVVQLADTYGCCAKTSGAGGGDGCILFAPDSASFSAAMEALAFRGLQAIPIEVSRLGAREIAARETPM